MSSGVTTVRRPRSGKRKRKSLFVRCPITSKALRYSILVYAHWTMETVCNVLNSSIFSHHTRSLLSGIRKLFSSLLILEKSDQCPARACTVQDCKRRRKEQTRTSGLAKPTLPPTRYRPFNPIAVFVRSPHHPINVLLEQMTIPHDEH
jgi:hypothetical protein